MYLSFYGLDQHPFNATPDPRFLFLTPSHREALAQLMYGVQENKGFIVLTGEVGTGKTTLLQTLLKRLDATTAIAYIYNSTLPFEELLEYMLADFGIAKPGESRAQRLFALNNFLIERRRAGQNTVLLIDEAQNLDVPTLEQVRLLSNFESTTEKLLQILLVGQPELKVKLDRPELRQLKQRIGLRCRISPLTATETRDYIRTRLRIAGARHAQLFTEAAVQRITEYAGGIPRVINILCDHCLLVGYADQVREIDRDIVERGIQYLEDGALPKRRRGSFFQERRRRLWPWAAGAALVAVAGASVVALAATVMAAPIHAVGAALEAVTTSISSLADTTRGLLVR